MNSDELHTIDDSDEAAWVARERQTVVNYLEAQGCDHNGVSFEPRWFVSPYVAVWAVRSKTHPDRVGWWAISGDLPTDYMAATDQRSTGDVLIAFASRWRAAAEQMKEGRHLEGYVIGDPLRVKEFEPLLRSRAELLYEFGENLNDEDNDEEATGDEPA